MKKHVLTIVLVVCLLSLAIGCSDDDQPTSSTGGPAVYELLASHCDPLVITVAANQTVTITVTDSVITNPTGTVTDCDFWCDADGIPDCHYVGTVDYLHNLSFMALVAEFNGDWILIGKNFDSTFTEAGDLNLKVNDWGPCGEDSDNAGRFMITVDIN